MLKRFAFWESSIICFHSYRDNIISWPPPSVLVLGWQGRKYPKFDEQIPDFDEQMSRCWWADVQFLMSRCLDLDEQMSNEQVYYDRFHYVLSYIWCQGCLFFLNLADKVSEDGCSPEWRRPSMFRGARRARRGKSWTLTKPRWKCRGNPKSSWQACKHGVEQSRRRKSQKTMQCWGPALF